VVSTDDVRRPTLNLSRLGQKNLRVPIRSQPSTALLQQPNQTSHAASKNCGSQSPSFSSWRQQLSLPIPSSFIDTSYLNNDSDSQSSCSSSSSDESAARQKRHAQKQAKKEAMRQKLSLCKAALLSDSMEQSKLQSPTTRSSGQSDVSSSRAQSPVMKENSQVRSNEKLEKRKAAANAATEEAACKRKKETASDLLAPSAESTDVAPIPSEVLQSAIDRVFAETASQPNGLDGCTMKQIVVAIQAKFSTPFSKETIALARARVRFLTKEHVSKQMKSIPSSTEPSIKAEDDHQSSGGSSQPPPQANQDDPQPPEVLPAEVKGRRARKQPVPAFDDRITENSCSALKSSSLSESLQTRSSDMTDLCVEESSVAGNEGPSTETVITTKLKAKRAPRSKPVGRLRGQPSSRAATCNLCGSCPCKKGSADSTAPY
jgi:hypothetical protein